MTPIQRLLESNADMITIPFHTKGVCPLCGRAMGCQLCGRVAVHLDGEAMLAPAHLLADLPPGSVIQ